MKASRKASRHSDVEVTTGAMADTVDSLSEPPAASKPAETTGADVSSASESVTKLRKEFFSGSMTEERAEVQTSVASTMTPFRCVTACLSSVISSLSQYITVSSYYCSPNVPVFSCFLQTYIINLIF